MLNFKYLFGGPPQAVVDYQLLLLAVGTVAYWLILGYYKGQSRKVRNIILTDTSINANWSVSVKTNLSPSNCWLPTGNLSADAYPVDWVCRAAFLPPRSLALLVGCEEGHQRWPKESEYLCSYDLLQAMSRVFSQWPNTAFKVPDLLQWIVVATEPSMIEDIRKAPEDVLSLMDALDEVSSFRSSPRPTNWNVFSHFNSNTLSEDISERIRITSLSSEHNSPGLFHNSCQRFMKKLLMLLTNLYLWLMVRSEHSTIYGLILTSR